MTAEQATFGPRNKSLYTGTAGRALMAHAGEPCLILARVTWPATQTKSRKEERKAIIRFPNHVRQFIVRIEDVASKDIPVNS